MSGGDGVLAQVTPAKPLTTPYASLLEKSVLAGRHLCHRHGYGWGIAS